MMFTKHIICDKDDKDFKVNSNVEPLRCYRGGEDFKKWCRFNNINDNSYSLTNKYCLFYVEDNEVKCFFKKEYEGDSLLISKGFIVEIPVPEIKRWRAKFGEKFWYIDSTMVVGYGIESSNDCNEDDDEYYSNKLYKSKNYFQTKEEADKKLKDIIEILNKDI